MNRHVLFLLAAAGSVGVPMMTSDDDLDTAFQSGAEIQPNGSQTQLLDAETADGIRTGNVATLQPVNSSSAMAPIVSQPVQGRVLSSTTLTGPELVSFTELLQFSVTPDWIFQHWSRVSTVTEQPTLQGYRVPVVTGTQAFDMAGSLTYYYNSDQQLQRIVFHGTTGDARPLVQWVASQHELLPQETSQPGLQLYQKRWHGAIVSELRVQPSSVVQQQDTFTRYQVDLLLERPPGKTIFKPGESTGPSWRL